MVICVDRVRKKTDKFLDLIYKSNPKNFYYKSDTIDVSNKSPRVFRGITRIETIKQCDFHNIYDFTCHWPSVFLLAKPYVPNS